MPTPSIDCPTCGTRIHIDENCPKCSIKQPAAGLFSGDSRPARRGWAPGHYSNRCGECGNDFIGDKRAVLCADCAYFGRRTDEDDSVIEQCIQVLSSDRQHAGVSLIQQRLRLGYTRAARIMDELEDRGIVGPSQSDGRRKVLLP